MLIKTTQSELTIINYRRRGQIWKHLQNQVTSIFHVMFWKINFNKTLNIMLIILIIILLLLMILIIIVMILIIIVMILIIKLIKVRLNIIKIILLIT